METETIIKISTRCVLALIIIVLLIYQNKLLKDLKYYKEVRKVLKHKLMVVENEKVIYKDKYLDVVSKFNRYKNTQDYKEEIKIDAKNGVSCVEMARKYGLKADTIRKALYRWGVKGVK